MYIFFNNLNSSRYVYNSSKPDAVYLDKFSHTYKWRVGYFSVYLSHYLSRILMYLNLYFSTCYNTLFEDLLIITMFIQKLCRLVVLFKALPRIAICVGSILMISLIRFVNVPSEVNLATPLYSPSHISFWNTF